MSKSWAPAPDGLPTHSTKVRVIGGDTPAAQAVLDSHWGQISQYINAQHQRAQLSGLPQQKSSTTIGGVRVTYTNNNGQDTVVVEVRTSGGEEKSEQSSEAYWKWAIIETTIPDIQNLTSAAMSAFMTPPPNNGKLGIALDHADPFDLDKPPLSYPVDSLGIFIEDVQDNTQSSSLRVDLRPYPGGVKFDLYGYIHKYQDGFTSGPNTSAAYHAAVTANSVGQNATVTQSGGGTLPWTDPADVSARTQSNVLYQSTTPANIVIDFPELTGATFTSSSLPTGGDSYAGGPTVQGPSYGGGQLVWGTNSMPTGINAAALISAAGGLFTETTTFGADGLIKKVRGLGAVDYYSSGGVLNYLAGAGPTQAQGNYGITFYDYTLYWIGDHPSVPNYVYPNRSCPIAFVVLDEGPDAMTNRFGSPLRGNSYRWEASKKYPGRWPLKQLDTIAMHSKDDPVDQSIANHFGMTKLGTVIINPRKGKGGIKFIAA